MGIFARWAAFCLLMGLAVAVMVINKLTVCSWMRRRNPAASVSLLGGLLGALACDVSPSALLHDLWWMPSLLDVLATPVWRFIQTLRFRLERDRYSGHQS
jgi:hypothetical protein